MNKHKRQIPHHQPARTMGNRPGEGVVVEVVVEQFTSTDGTAISQFGINLAMADVPDRRYTADACAISEVSGTLKWMFGQARIDDNGWRSLLVVHMPREAVARYLTSVEQMSNPSVEEVAAVGKFPVEALTKKVTEPEQAVALTANLCLTAVSGNEACLDFYQASPFTMGSVMQSRKMALDPVVRVDLRTSLYIAALDGIRGLGIKPEQFRVPGKAT